MNRLAALLGADRPVLLDGGMGTLLQDSGLEDGAPGELWNLENPDAVRAAHAAYAEAGARLLTTNTFGGTRPRLDMHGLGDRLGEVNRTAAQLARSVAEERGLLVAGDLGPTGELLAPLGTMTREEAQALFAEQLMALVEGGIDLVLVETLSDLGEADAALAAAREVAPGLPVAVTMSFDTNVRTMMGVRPGDAVCTWQRQVPTPWAPTAVAVRTRWRSSLRRWCAPAPATQWRTWPRQVPTPWAPTAVVVPRRWRSSPRRWCRLAPATCS